MIANNMRSAVQTQLPPSSTVRVMNRKLSSVPVYEREVLDSIFERGEVSMGIHHYFTYIRDRDKVAYSNIKFLSKSKEQVETVLISKEEYYDKAHKLVGEIGRLRYNPEPSNDVYFF